MNEFNIRLKELRNEKEITQKQFAADIGVLERTVSHWEQGKRECDFDMLIKVAKYFNVTTDYLLGLEK